MDSEMTRDASHCTRDALAYFQADEDFELEIAIALSASAAGDDPDAQLLVRPALPRHSARVRFLIHTLVCGSNSG
jgi:hypothetical protein